MKPLPIFWLFQQLPCPIRPYVTIFTKLQFSGKRINIFTIFFSIYFWGINHNMITNFWHNRDKLTQLFCVVKKMAHNSHWLCVQMFTAWLHPLNFFQFFSYFTDLYDFITKMNKMRGCPVEKWPILFLVNHDHPNVDDDAQRLVQNLCFEIIHVYCTHL